MGDNDCHVDSRIGLSCYKRKYPQRICRLKQVRHHVCRRKNGYLQLQQRKIKRNFTMREFAKFMR